MPSIKSQSIVIIGGSSGIGAAAAKLACQEGVKVAIASSNPGRIDDAVKKIKAAVPEAHISGYAIDISGYDMEEHLEKLFTQVTEANGGPLDHIILTAGLANVKPISEYTAEHFKEAAPLRLLAPVMIAKLAPRFLKPHWTSSIIFTGGSVGEKPVRGYALGAGWAASLFGTVRALALEMAPIRVNAVSPGATETELWGPDGEGRDKIASAVSAGALLGKAGRPEEVGEAYVYLMKDTNNTGSVVSSSGGVLIQ
ncbi:Carbonyl reductase family member 4 [Cytospora mali]|uniref:Carbonyl reductase family member 4 n=1 Tax=Cytospora mali TaxID=578113 RepID=A0A194UUK2_CYTMA|nr:Carbonyl reductase family member 4 [Valsa mali var. pyri (nom. inval.)]